MKGSDELILQYCSKTDGG
uniref:Uncharacterized protein n=1 Tax=Anguilla anguilla TaxID=7936 RepID=A0A0E9UFG0_ANGAN